MGNTILKAFLPGLKYCELAIRGSGVQEAVFIR